MSYSKIALAGTVGSVPKTMTIDEQLNYTTFTLYIRATYVAEPKGWDYYYEAHRIVCVGTLGEFALSIKMDAKIEVEGELRSRLHTIHLTENKDLQITYRVWEIIATSIRPDMSYAAATQKGDVSAALNALYKPVES